MYYVILLTVLLECKTEKRNSQCEQTANGVNKRLLLHVRLRFGSLSITTPVSHLASEFNVQRELHKLHGQVSLAAVNQILCCS